MQMGQAFGKFSDSSSGNNEIRVIMMGLGASGKTTILEKLQSKNENSTVGIPTVGLNVENVKYKNVLFIVGEIGGQCSHYLRPHYFYNDALIYVVDSLNHERFEVAKAEFQDIIKHPSMLNRLILVLANKQDMKGAMTAMEVCEGLGLLEVKDRKWDVKGTCALTGDGLYEGLDWFISTLSQIKAVE
ncbi:uncharacterized protein LOC130014507 [Mercurialis annua]|uniref:uncharacterized protein LOC130014507 n=1 Tax=Mercurialis annua TaxID=3986 RepID=UPI0021604CFA|nr:uncharacterized protein LOC130014507 [Mercurialis annua]XP_050225295.1 uncharacterized protein LOC130014507 [Mercurialis annua]